MTVSKAQQQLELIRKMKGRPENYKELLAKAIQDYEKAFVRERQEALPFTIPAANFQLF